MIMITRKNTSLCYLQKWHQVHHLGSFRAQILVNAGAQGHCFIPQCSNIQHGKTHRILHLHPCCEHVDSLLIYSSCKDAFEEQRSTHVNEARKHGEEGHQRPPQYTSRWSNHVRRNNRWSKASDDLYKHVDWSLFHFLIFTRLVSPKIRKNVLSAYQNPLYRPVMRLKAIDRMELVSFEDFLILYLETTSICVAQVLKTGRCNGGVSTRPIQKGTSIRASDFSIQVPSSDSRPPPTTSSPYSTPNGQGKPTFRDYLSRGRRGKGPPSQINSLETLEISLHSCSWRSLYTAPPGYWNSLDTSCMRKKQRTWRQGTLTTKFRIYFQAFSCLATAVPQRSAACEELETVAHYLACMTKSSTSELSSCSQLGAPH